MKFYTQQWSIPLIMFLNLLEKPSTQGMVNYFMLFLSFFLSFWVVLSIFILFKCVIVLMIKYCVSAEQQR